MSNSDLDAIRAEAPPRSDATSRRLAKRIASTGGFIGYGVLWLFPALYAACLPLFIAIMLIDKQATPLQANLIFASFGLLFLLSWVAFGGWVVRRRRAARAFIRDGLIAEGIIDGARQGAVRGGVFTSGGVRFIVDGIERRAVFAVDGSLHSTTVPVLWARGSRHALVFPPSKSGHAVAARVADDIALELAPGNATIKMTRGRSELMFAIMLGFTAPFLLLLAIATIWQKPAELRCERVKDECTLSGHTVFGTGWESEFPASGMTRSALERKQDEVKWVVKLSGPREVELGGLTSRAAQVEGYRRHSAELTAFIGDRTQRSFVAQFQAIGGVSLPVAIGMVLVTAWIFFALLHGWRTTLKFDRSAGTLTITRRPALLPPSVRTLPLSSVVRFDTRAGAIWVMFASLPTLTLRLYDGNDKVLFKRRLITSSAARREIDAVNEVLAAKREVAT